VTVRYRFVSKLNYVYFREICRCQGFEREPNNKFPIPVFTNDSRNANLIVYYE
jgi:hypothetical protein